MYKDPASKAGFVLPFSHLRLEQFELRYNFPTLLLLCGSLIFWQSYAGRFRSVRGPDSVIESWGAVSSREVTLHSLVHILK